MLRFGQRLIVTVLQRVRHISATFTDDGITPEYRTWRDRFLWQRLHLWLWLALMCLLTFTIRNIYDLYFPLKEFTDLPRELKNQALVIYPVMYGCILTCLAIHKTKFGRRHPGVLFLGLSWSITLVEQIFATINGFAIPDLIAWSLVFLSQATFIPVRWTLHLTSQLVVLIYYFGVNTVLGLNLPVPGKSLYNATIILFLFWFCFICDFAVYLYDRLQRSEFYARREREQAQEALRIFFHAVSHDLRNPVLGTLMVLKNLLSRPEEKILVSRGILERMEQSSDRQLSLINSLMEAHLSEVQGIVLQRQPIQLNTVVEAAIADLKQMLVENQVTLTNSVTTDLPTINADSTQLWRVFSNLIVNAVKHNPPGLSITINAQLEGEQIYCTVADNGVGISQKQSEHLFDLYFRGGNLRNSVSLGLGLYLCKQIITAHGGEIGVKSAPNAGATFWLTLPLYNAKYK
ncbi:sensor histidine kinase [Iningainema tapete]|uniref:histidine kinase n=1 Tax=Iningainema tapete BLCC-T55 TaxID=2748662 RepID=A0A8J7CG92_9CYAN|nr:HAMP domain-containing sensor histidine kinase [Iningainema tapete]MBD2776070.1 HAMP domain-containing histidine kinase [Iningainema tapete BLCC-T55]